MLLSLRGLQVSPGLLRTRGRPDRRPGEISHRPDVGLRARLHGGVNLGVLDLQAGERLRLAPALRDDAPRFWRFWSAIGLAPRGAAQEFEERRTSIS